MKHKKPGSVRQHIAKYTAITAVTLKETLYHRNKLISTVFISTFRLIMLALIYKYAYAYLGTTINGIDQTTAVWSIAIYHILLFTQFRSIFRTIKSEHQKGSLEVQLNKPYNYLVYKCFEQLGKGIPNLVINLVISIPILIVLVGPPPALTPLLAVSALLLTICGTLVSAAIYACISLTNLWIEDAEPVFWIVDKAVLILGGAYIPIALFPPRAQTAAHFSPFGAPMFATKIFNPNFAYEWPSLLLMQVVWIVVFILLTHTYYKATQKVLAINGG